MPCHGFKSSHLSHTLPRNKRTPFTFPTWPRNKRTLPFTFHTWPRNKRTLPFTFHTWPRNKRKLPFNFHTWPRNKRTPPFTFPYDLTANVHYLLLFPLHYTFYPGILRSLRLMHYVHRFSTLPSTFCTLPFAFPTLHFIFYTLPHAFCTILTPLAPHIILIRHAILTSLVRSIRRVSAEHIVKRSKVNNSLRKKTWRSSLARYK